MTPATNIYEAGLRAFPDFALGGQDVSRHRGRWAGFFAERVGPAFGGRVVLDVGCADAAHLAAVAAAHPAVGFVGLDWKFKALHAGAGRVAAAGLRNVALLRGRAGDLPAIFGAGEVDEVWVFHPEPCAGPAQRANRLVAEPFLTAAHTVLRDEASTLALKTDHAGYFQWVLGLAGAAEPAAFRAARERAVAGLPFAGAGPHVRARDLLRPDEVPPPSDAVQGRFAVAAVSADYWGDAAALAHTAGRCFAGSLTPYEARFVGRRRPIYYVELRKT